MNLAAHILGRCAGLALGLALTLLTSSCGHFLTGDADLPAIGGGSGEDEACTEVSDLTCADRLTLGKDSKTHLLYYRSRSLQTPHPAITRAIIMIQGFKRRPQAAFERVNDIADALEQSQATVVLAPWFKTEDDSPEPGEATWTENGWSRGDESRQSSGVSSFEALDALIDAIAGGAFPDLQTIVIAGLSAGGQMTQRFAAGSRVEDAWPALKFRYVVAGPSSYLYLNEKRQDRLTPFGFAPPLAPGCEYNSYRYGLRHRNRYMRRLDDIDLRHQYLARDVVYLVGADDDASTRPIASGAADRQDSGDLDVSCAAKWQGESRKTRSLVYAAYLDREFPGHRHHQEVIAGVAHQLGLFATDRGEAWLFDTRRQDIVAH